MRFVKGFQHIVMLIAVIAFLLIIMLITIRQVKKLPLSYAILILDNHGEKIILPDVRLHLESMKVQKVMLSFTETCMDNNTNSE
jgi:hypothetical protein